MAAAPHLPEPVLRHIFSIESQPGETILGIKDRVRCQAVCSTWRAYLDPHNAEWPLGRCKLMAVNNLAWALSAWVCQTQPAVRELEVLVDDELTFDNSPGVQTVYRALLSVQREALQSVVLVTGSDLVSIFWPALQLFPRLRELVVCSNSSGELDDRMLRGLPALESLRLRHLRAVRMLGNLDLTRLASLRLESCQEFDLDAALPALRQLAFTFGRSFLLGGDLLHLPQLTRIELAAPLYDEVDWSVDLGVHSVPTLAELQISGRACLPRPESLRLSTLTRLTALTAAFHPAEAAEIGTLLRAAPPSLRSLKLLCFNWGCPGREQADLIDQLAPGIWSLTQLTSLAAVAQLALDLRAALPSLQQFTAVDLPPAMVTMEHAVGLWDLPSLRRLVLQPMEEDEALERDCLGLLRRALPAGWEVAVEAVEQEEVNPFTGLDPLDFLED